MLRAIPVDDVKRLCAGQVIVDLCSIVKELLENALDAGATNVEIRVNHNGAKGVEVIDNGTGVPQGDHASLARKHHTSKLLTFDDLDALSTHGFRGEALASLANVAKLSVVTRTAADATGFQLEFDHAGELTSSRPAAREIGTSVSVADVFCNLPVRQGEFVKNIAKEYARLVPVVQAYALVAVGVRISLCNVTATGKRQLVFASVGAPRMLDNVAAVFTAKEAQSLEPIEVDAMAVGGDGAGAAAVRVDGAVTSLCAGAGRRTNDRHFFFINRRPVDIAQLPRIATDCFRVAGQNDGRFPFVALNFTVPSDRVDINVTPDKRTVYLADHERFLEAVRALLGAHYAASHGKAHVMGASVAASQSSVIPLRFAPLAGIPRAQPVAPAHSHECAHDHAPVKTEAAGSSPDDAEVVLTPEEVRAPPRRRDDDEGPRNVFESFSFAAPPPPPRSASSALPVRGATPPPPPSSPPPAQAVSLVPVKRGLSQLATSTITKLWKEQASRKRAHDDPDAEPAPAARHGVVRITDDEPVVFDAMRQLSARAPQAAHDGDDDGDDDLNDTTVHFDMHELERRLHARVAMEVPVKRNKTAADDCDAAPPTQGIAHELRTTFRKEAFADLHVVGQFNNGFIIARLGLDDLFIIDQHASNEIYNFETLQRTTVMRTQRLLKPVTLDFAPDEELDVLSNLRAFERNGFVLHFDDDAAPGKKVKLVGRPESKGTTFGEEDVRELLMLIHESGSGATARPSRVRAMFASRACRMSVMIGEPLSMDKMRRIVADLATLQAPWACPHGRPTMRHLTKL